jgi:hypothetical protein
MVGQYISDELKEMALSMSLQGLRDSEVHKFTGISVTFHSDLRIGLVIVAYFARMCRRLACQRLVVMY